MGHGGVPIYLYVIAFFCTCGAIALSLLHIYRHLLNYTEPTFQRYIVRIVFMVPVYALMSFLALVIPMGSIYFDSIREGYEAWVIYNFLSLCLAWVGGPGAVVLSLSGRILKPSWFLMTCCLPPLPLDGRFIRKCKQGCLQFVILKPILVVLTLILYEKGKYKDGNFSPTQSYLYLTIIYTISYTVALYALALFYVACRDLLQPFNPVPKFIIIKSVVFLTYWQWWCLLSNSSGPKIPRPCAVVAQDTFAKDRNTEPWYPLQCPLCCLNIVNIDNFLMNQGVLVFLAAKSGFIKDADEAAQLQNIIICVEMLLAALGHFYAFPYKEYAGANIGASRGLSASLAHALMLNDFYHDTVHQFAPTYHDYVLYNHDGDEGPRKYRSRTFVPIGPEMESVRRNKPNIASKSDDARLSGFSSDSNSPKDSGPNSGASHSGAAKSSLLVDTSNSISVPYDFTLIDLDGPSYPSANKSGNR